jgi:hypothetical protein
MGFRLRVEVPDVGATVMAFSTALVNRLAGRGAGWTGSSGVEYALALDFVYRIRSGIAIAAQVPC